MPLCLDFVDAAVATKPFRVDSGEGPVFDADLIRPACRSVDRRPLDRAVRRAAAKAARGGRPRESVVVCGVAARRSTKAATKWCPLGTTPRCKTIVVSTRHQRCGRRRADEGAHDHHVRERRDLPERKGTAPGTFCSERARDASMARGRC